MRGRLARGLLAWAALAVLGSAAPPRAQPLESKSEFSQLSWPGSPGCIDLGGPACERPTPPTPPHHLRVESSCGFGLTLVGDVAATQARITALAARTGGTRDLRTLTDDLDRTLRPDLPAQWRQEVRTLTGLRWDAADNNDPRWYPQGITGSDDAFATERDPELLLVSWYQRGRRWPIHGARISLVQPQGEGGAYRHLLLFSLAGTAEAPVLQAALSRPDRALHASGMVWLHPWLYVADTRNGLRIYDASRVVPLSTDGDAGHLGVRPGGIDGFGYAYGLVEVARTHQVGTCPIRFSSLSLDRSTDPPALVSAEYQRDTDQGRAFRWALDPQTGWLRTDTWGEVHPHTVVTTGERRVQGALSQGDRWWFSASNQLAGRCLLYRASTVGPSLAVPWPRGCEDLYLQRRTGRLWTVTEHPGQRALVSVPLE